MYVYCQNLRKIFLSVSTTYLLIINDDYQLISIRLIYIIFYLIIIQSDQKLTQPIPDTYLICQKINYIRIRKQKNNVILTFGKVHRVQRHLHSPFSSCLMERGVQFMQ